MTSWSCWTICLSIYVLFRFSVIRTFAAECIVPTSGDGVTDDSPAILEAFADCANNSVVSFSPANYSVFTPISLLGLNNVTVLLNGNLNLPQNITKVQQEINTTSNQASTYATPWFYIQGTDVQIIGSKETNWGQFNGFGQQWWDIGLRTLRPQLATFNVTNGLLRGLKIIKPIAWGWNLPGKNIRVENHFVDAKPDNSTRDITTSFPFNTDGFNLSGQNITVDGYIGHNGDDCISVVSGGRDILVQNGYCGFSSHGLSIGSLGKNGANSTVQNVLFKNWTMDGAVYAARFKSWTGGQGWANNVTWEDIKLVNVSTGIFITQNYYDQDKGPRPNNVNGTSTKITNFTYKNFGGTLGTNWTDGTCISDPCWNYVAGISPNTGIILDLYPDTASNITLEGIEIKPFNQTAQTTVLCNSSTLAPGEQDVLGFQCQNGPFVSTPVRTKNNDAASLNGSLYGLSIVLIALQCIL